MSPEIISVYKNEKIAEEAFKEYRLRHGIECKKCGSEQHYWLPSKKQFQCKNCRFRTTLQSGTLLEGSKLPISYFFITLHLLIKSGNNLSAEELQLHTGHKYSDPLFDLIRKVRLYLKSNDQHAVLIDFVEITQKVLFAEKLN